MSVPLQFYSHGKLLLSGEYLVLEGANALAVPVRFGQHMEVKQGSNDQLVHWESKDVHQKTWFTCTLDETFRVLSTNAEQSANLLKHALEEIHQVNPQFKDEIIGKEIITQLEFERGWGFGSSSTFINNLAEWSQTDAFALNQALFEGSGYDIACAKSSHPLLYRLSDSKPHWEQVNLHPIWNDIRFVFLNQKQSSLNEIKRFKGNAEFNQRDVEEISELTNLMITTGSIVELTEIVQKHELLMAKILGKTPIQDQLFPDFDGQIKSLGAWGGDFVMAVSQSNQKRYFEEKGFPISFSFEELRITKHL